MEEAQPVSQAATSHTLDVRFTGSGGDYFRIWIVNLLLTIVTLGIYYPWAKVRRLRYFHTNTLVGEHAFDFHGDPRKMLRGYLLAGAMVALYSMAGQFSRMAGLAAFLLVGGAFPALLWASLRFRLANTSWRGLRMHFTGSIGGAYRALLAPLLLLAALFLVLALFGDGEQAAPLVGIAFLAVLVLFYLLAPLFVWLLRKYQHDHYALGDEQTTLRVGPGPFYLVSLKVMGVFLLGVIAVGAAAGLAFYALGTRSREVTVIVVLLGYLALLTIVWPYAQSRMQNLLWSNTASTHLGFHSALKARPLMALTLKNVLLVILTLGFYWPYAAVALARMRLEAIRIQAGISPDELAANRQRSDDAAGDAAGDLLGFDIGF